jgi:hypothetical protein
MAESLLETAFSCHKIEAGMHWWTMSVYQWAWSWKGNGVTAGICNFNADTEQIHDEK